MGLLSARTVTTKADGTTVSTWDRTTLYRWLVLAGVSLSGDGWTYEATVIGSVIQLPAFIGHLGYTGALPDNIGQWVGPIYTLGQLFGGLLAAFISDWFGRKPTLYVGSVLVILSTALLIGSPNVATVLIARVIQGLSIGFLLLGYQVYAVELASRRDRGFVSGFTLITGNVFGLIASFIVYGVSYSAGNWGWRLAIGISFIPSVSLFIVLHFVPESPRWLYDKGRAEEARLIMGRFHGFKDGSQDELSPNAEEEFEAMCVAIDEDRKRGLDKWSALWNTGSARYRLFVSLSSQFYWAWNGSAIETYYFTTIFTAAGVGNPHTQFGIGTILNVMWVIGGFIGSYLLDVLGRRFSYTFGLAQMGFWLVLQGAISIRYFDGATTSKAAGAIWIAIYLIKWSLWVTFFSPTVNVLPAELWPSGLRARGFALSNVVSMAIGFATQYSALPMYRHLEGWTWILFAFVMFGSAFLVWLVYPEPKGLILEEIEILFGSPASTDIAAVTGLPLTKNMAPIQRIWRGKKHSVPSAFGVAKLDTNVEAVSDDGELTKRPKYSREDSAHV